MGKDDLGLPAGFDLTKMQEAAAGLKEIYDSLIEVGFTADQALMLVAAMVRPAQKT